jgi:hypothetical protein
MAATASQGKSFTLFMVAITAAAAGVAFFSTGAGKLALVVGLIGLAISAISFIKIKPEEGKTGSVLQPVVLQLAGVASVLAGWLVVLFGIHAASSVSGRLFTTLLGLVISLLGVVVLLPAAANKNAIWKA